MLISKDQYLDLLVAIAEKLGAKSPKEWSVELFLGNCNHQLTHTINYLQEHHPDYRQTLEKIVDLGGHCDCEVLINAPLGVYQRSRRRVLNAPNIIGQSAWDTFIDDLMLNSNA